MYVFIVLSAIAGIAVGHATDQTLKNCKDYKAVFYKNNLHEASLCTTKPCEARMRTLTTLCDDNYALQLRWCMYRSCYKIDELLAAEGNTYVDETIQDCENAMWAYSKFDIDREETNCHKPCLTKFRDIVWGCTTETARALNWCVAQECGNRK